MQTFSPWSSWPIEHGKPSGLLRLPMQLPKKQMASLHGFETAQARPWSPNPVHCCVTAGDVLDAMQVPNRQMPLASRQTVPSRTIRGGSATVQLLFAHKPTLQPSSMHSWSATSPTQEETRPAGTWASAKLALDSMINTNGTNPLGRRCCRRGCIMVAPRILTGGTRGWQPHSYHFMTLVCVLLIIRPVDSS